MKQDKHRARHFLTASLALMGCLGAPHAHASTPGTLAEAEANTAPLSCSGALSSSLGAESIYFCQGVLNIGRGTLSASQSITITADGDITLTDVNTVTPKLVIESGQTVNLLGSFSGAGQLIIDALGIGPAIDGTSTLQITQPGSLTFRPAPGAEDAAGVVTLTDGGGGGSLVFSNPAGIVLGATQVNGDLSVSGLSADVPGGQLVILTPGTMAATSTLSSAGQNLSAFVAATIPEPGTWALMGLGLVGIAAAARRRA